MPMCKPRIYKRGKMWIISPTGIRDGVFAIAASTTFAGACKIARQCYNPKRSAQR